MIRINLLAVERDRTKRRAGIEVGQKVTIGCSVILVVTVVAMGWRFWTLREQGARLTQDIAAANLAIGELAPILESVREHDEARAQLTQRVTLIEQLRTGQAGPVRMLDEVSRSLPDGLWLTELRQEPTMVVVQGRATTLRALSDFVASLELSGFFAPPVELVDSQLEDQQGQGEVVRFELRATFQLPGS